MQKAEPQQTKVQSQPAAKQGSGVVADTPQTEQITQLEAMIETSPQMARLGNMAAMMNAGPAMSAQRKLADMMHNSQRQQTAQEFAEGIYGSPLMVAQRKKLESMFGTAQRVEDEEPLQGKFAAESSAQLQEEPSSKPNNTGLPDNLKSGIENLSGMSMDNVKVHYNSSQPAQLNALAYAQGTDIHVAPGQEKHLPHEAWHVVQQAQGRVRPTMQMKDGIPVNDDHGLEREADVMGARAASIGQTAVQRSSGGRAADAGVANVLQKQEAVMTEETGAQSAEIVSALGKLKEGLGAELKSKPQWAEKASEFETALSEVTTIMSGSEGPVKWALMSELLQQFEDNKSELKQKAETGEQSTPEEGVVQGNWLSDLIKNNPKFILFLLLVIVILIWVLTRSKQTSVQNRVLEAIQGREGELDWVKGNTPAIVNKEAAESHFTNWLLGHRDNPGTSMNCWELVLYGAFQAGVVTKERLVGFYDTARQNNPGSLSGGKRPVLEPKHPKMADCGTGMTIEAILNPSQKRKHLYDKGAGGWLNTLGAPDSGDLVYFGSGLHVVIATGGGKAVRDDECDQRDLKASPKYRSGPLYDYAVYSLLEGQNSGHVQRTTVMRLQNSYRDTYTPIWAFKPIW